PRRRPAGGAQSGALPGDRRAERAAAAGRDDAAAAAGGGGAPGPLAFAAAADEGVTGQDHLTQRRKAAKKTHKISERSAIPRGGWMLMHRHPSCLLGFFLATLRLCVRFFGIFAS